MSLKEKRVVVLGGTSGLGFATAKAAAREGASVVVVSAKAERVARAQALLPAGTEGHVVDLTDEGQVAALFEKIGAFDHLVFTAGDWLLLGDFLSLDIAAARRAFDVRYWGAVMAAKYGAPLIRKGGSSCSPRASPRRGRSRAGWRPPAFWGRWKR